MPLCYLLFINRDQPELVKEKLYKPYPELNHLNP
jgi:hypothetical protein